MAAIKMVTKISDLLVPKYFNLDKIGITQSLLSTWMMCPRRFLLAINLYTRTSSWKNTLYGTMVHDVLDKIYTNYFFKKVSYTGLKNLVDAEIKNHKFDFVLNAEEKEYLKASAVAILHTYLIRYRKDFTECRFEAVEKTFEVDFHNYILRGKVDGCFRDKNKGRWNIEHKNYSKINEENMLLKLSIDLQNQFYILADLLESKEQLKGTLYNILRKPDIRKKLSPSETYKYISGLIKENPAHYFIRYEIPYSKQDIKQFSSELWFKLTDLNSMLTECKMVEKNTLNIFYRNESACEAPYKCQYLEACSSGTLCGYTKKPKLYTEL